jgi:hypothetical protein
VTLSDTSQAAQALQLKIQSAMSGEQRIVLAYEMSMFARELARAGIERDYPDWTEAQVARELLRLAFLPAPLPVGLPSIDEETEPTKTGSVRVPRKNDD